MTKKRTIDNSKRPAQPEPGEDEAVRTPPPVREQAREVRKGDRGGPGTQPKPRVFYR